MCRANPGNERRPAVRVVRARAPCVRVRRAVLTSRGARGHSGRASRAAFLAPRVATSVTPRAIRPPRHVVYPVGSFRDPVAVIERFDSTNDGSPWFLSGSGFDRMGRSQPPGRHPDCLGEDIFFSGAVSARVSRFQGSSRPDQSQPLCSKPKEYPVADLAARRSFALSSGR